MKWTHIYLILIWLIISALTIKIIDIKNELQTLNKTLIEINHAMIEQNTILKFNPNDFNVEE